MIMRTLHIHYKPTHFIIIYSILVPNSLKHCISRLSERKISWFEVCLLAAKPDEIHIYNIGVPQ